MTVNGVFTSDLMIRPKVDKVPYDLSAPSVEPTGMPSSLPTGTYEIQK